MLQIANQKLVLNQVWWVFYIIWFRDKSYWSVFALALSLPQHLWYLWDPLLKIFSVEREKFPIFPVEGENFGPDKSYLVKITGLYSFDSESDTSISLVWFQRLCWNPPDLHPYEISIRPQCFQFSFVILGPSVLLPLLNTMFLKHQMCLWDEGIRKKKKKIAGIH